MACLKCPRYVPKETAQLIEARDGVLRLMQEIPLTDEEKSVAEGDITALNRYIEKRKHVRTPQIPSERYVSISSCFRSLNHRRSDSESAGGNGNIPGNSFARFKHLHADCVYCVA
jgi:hypothetical protein